MGPFEYLLTLVSVILVGLIALYMAKSFGHSLAG